MFKEIRKKISLWNALTLIAFLILFIITILAVVQWSLKSSGEAYLENVAQAVIHDTKPTEGTGFMGTSVHDQLGYEYLVWNENRSISSQQTDQQAMIKSGYALLEKDAKDPFFSKVKVGESEYRVYETQFERGGKTMTLQVFQNLGSENGIMLYITVYLLSIGAVGLLILIPLSYILAGRSLKPIKENFDLQKTFIADASHELRTPITVIRTNVEVLEMKEDEPISENMKWLQAIDEECDTMANLISELLTNAQSEVNQNKDEKGMRFSLSQACAESVKKLKPVARELDVKLTTSLVSDVMFNGNEDKIKQLIRIFLDNALKYTPAGGQVSLGLSEAKRNVTISIQDNGLGIPKDEQKKIFSRFYRIDDARSRASGGSGLGLSIADSIVRGMGGKIRLDSEPGVGSTFTIILPKKKIQSFSDD